MNTTFIIAIDPATVTGFAEGYLDHEIPRTWTKDYTPKKATKGKKATKKNPAIPGRPAEANHLRYGKMWADLVECLKHLPNECDVYVICENAAGFTRGKAAIEVSNKFRGVVEAFCAYYELNYIAMQPADLKRYAVGKGVAEKEEMIVAARRRGYSKEVEDDNEADAFLMWLYLRDYVRNIKPSDDETDCPC